MRRLRQRRAWYSTKLTGEAKKDTSEPQLPSGAEAFDPAFSFPFDCIDDAFWQGILDGIDANRIFPDADMHG